MEIEKGRRVRIKVRLAVVGGDELEKTVVEYFHGGGSMLPGLEAELLGLTKGSIKKGVIKAKNAFGNQAMHPKKTMSRSEFPKDLKLEPGSQFTAKGANNGLDVLLNIIEVKDDQVTVRLVHPLADKDIEYDVAVISVSDPTPPPLPPGAVALEEADDAEE